MDCGRECVRSGGDGRFLSRSPLCRRCSCRSLSRPVRWRQSRAGLNSRFASQQRDVGLDLVTSVAGPSCQRHMLTLPVGVDGGATGPDVVRMRRSIRIANPLVPAAERSCGPAFAITEFATDSPLEGDGFEPLVPQREGMGLFETTLIGLWSLYLRGKQLTSPEGPGVCIRFAPAESPCLTQTRPLQVENRGFRAGVRANQATMRERKTRSSAVTTSAAPRATDVKSCICGRVNPKRHRTSSVTAMPEHCRWPGTIPPSGSAHGPRHRPPWWPRRRLGRCRRPLPGECRTAGGIRTDGLFRKEGAPESSSGRRSLLSRGDRGFESRFLQRRVGRNCSTAR